MSLCTEHKANVLQILVIHFTVLENLPYFFFLAVCNFKVERVGFLKLFIGDVVLIYEEGDGMFTYEIQLLVICISYKLQLFSGM